MKFDRLGETELARNVPLDPELQCKNLLKTLGGDARVWYAPVRKMYGDIFNVGSVLFGPGVPATLSAIEQILLKKCGSDSMRKHNLAVARSLYGYCIHENIHGIAYNFGYMYMGRAAGDVCYWLPMILTIRGRATVVFIDPRRPESRLALDSRRFVLSMMHEHIRKPNPDFANVQLAVIQFGDGSGVAGAPILHTDKGVTLYSYNELQDMVDVTYKLWDQLHAERRTAGLQAANP